MSRYYEICLSDYIEVCELILIHEYMGFYFIVAYGLYFTYIIARIFNNNKQIWIEYAELY